MAIKYPSKMSVIYIGNLDDRADARDLRDEFDRYGRIRDIWIARNPPGEKQYYVENGSIDIHTLQ